MKVWMPVLIIAAWVAASVSAQSASANLGGTTDSVEADRQALNGRTRVTAGASYTTHEITASSRKVREFVGPGGTVFAVTWQGRVPPDLNTLLGGYFAEYHDARNTGASRARGARVTRTEHVVVEESGHMRDVRGKAYLPLLVPPGVPLAEIR